MQEDREWFAKEAGRHAETPIGERIANNIRRIRMIRGLSQEELGQKVGVSRSVVSKVERGDHHPTAYRLSLYASALRVHVAFLLLDDPETAMVVDRGHTFFFQD